MVRITLPRYYDNFQTDSNLPLQCMLEPTLEDRSGEHRVKGIKVVYDDTHTAYYPLDRKYFKLPVPSGNPGPMKCRIRIIPILDDNSEGNRVIQRNVNVTGNARIDMDSDTFLQSLFIRMQLDKDFKMYNNYGSKLTYMDGCATINEAEYIMEELYYFLSDIKLRKTEFDEQDSNLMILQNFENGEIQDDGLNVYSLGLMFCYMAYKAGYRPVYIFDKDTCIVGVVVELSGSSDLFKKRNLTEKHVSGMLQTESFVLMDLSVRSSLTQALSAGYEKTENLEDKKICFTDVGLTLEHQINFTIKKGAE